MLLIHLCDIKPLNIETDTIKLNVTVTLVKWLTLIISRQFVFKKIYFIFNKSNLNDLDKKEKENMQCIKTDNQFLIDKWKILKQRYYSHLTLCFLQSKIELYPSTNPMVCRWACCSYMFQSSSHCLWLSFPSPSPSPGREINSRKRRARLPWVTKIRFKQITVRY